MTAGFYDVALDGCTPGAALAEGWKLWKLWSGRDFFLVWATCQQTIRVQEQGYGQEPVPI